MDSIFIIFIIFLKIRIHSSYSFKYYSFLFDPTGRLQPAAPRITDPSAGKSE